MGEPLSKEVERKFKIIVAIANHAPNQAEISELTGIPVPTIQRQLVLIRNEFGMDITFKKDSQSSWGRVGHYHIIDWGVLNRAKFLLRYSEILQLHPGSSH